MAKVLEIPGDFRKKPDTNQRPSKVQADGRGMNKTEAAYAEHLELRKLSGEVKSWKFNCVRLKLAGRKCKEAWFKGDFFVEVRTANGMEFEVHEAKGFWREASRVRIKVAADLYPCFRFIAVQRKGGSWQFEQF